MAAGDVNVNALTPITDEPTTTDSLVAVNRNTNEGEIIDYNLLADKILNKLTSKAYSGLSTTSKLLVGAINELDSDVASLNSSIDVINGKFKHIELKLVTITCDGVNQSDQIQVMWDTAFQTANDYYVVVSQNVGGTIFNGAVAEVPAKRKDSCYVRLVRPSSVMTGSSRIAVLAIE